MTYHTPSKILITLLTLTSLLTACGGGGGDAPSPEPSSVTSGGNPVVSSTPSDLAGIQVKLKKRSLEAEETSQAQLIGNYWGGADAPLFSNSATWETSDPAVATVSSTGLVTARGLGTVKITARLGSLVAYNTLGVSQPLTNVVYFGIGPNKVNLMLDDAGNLRVIKPAPSYRSADDLAISSQAEGLWRAVSSNGRYAIRKDGTLWALDYSPSSGVLSASPADTDNDWSEFVHLGLHDVGSSWVARKRDGSTWVYPVYSDLPTSKPIKALLGYPGEWRSISAIKLNDKVGGSPECLWGARDDGFLWLIPTYANKCLNYSYLGPIGKTVNLDWTIAYHPNQSSTTPKAYAGAKKLSFGPVGWVEVFNNTAVNQNGQSVYFFASDFGLAGESYTESNRILQYWRSTSFENRYLKEGFISKNKYDGKLYVLADQATRYALVASDGIKPGDVSRPSYLLTENNTHYMLLRNQVNGQWWDANSTGRRLSATPPGGTGEGPSPHVYIPPKPTSGGGTGVGGSAPQVSDCNVNTNSIVTIASSSQLPVSACQARISGFDGFYWGTDAGATHGSASGSCSSAKNAVFNNQRTACYCYTTTNSGSASAVTNGDWVCWVGY